MKPYILFAMLGLLTLACGAPLAVMAPTPEKVNTPIYVYATQVPQATAAPTPKSVTVTASETVWVRVDADPGARRVGYLEHGAPVDVFPPCVVSEDMGVWAFVAFEDLEGYVNTKFLEKGVCE